VLRSGLHVDLRILPERCYGAALHYFTGCKAHNIAVRKLGVEHGLRISEYGVFRVGKGRTARRIGGRTEEEVFRPLGWTGSLPNCAKIVVRFRRRRVMNCLN
jgi:DNA polymerase (family 10)